MLKRVFHPKGLKGVRESASGDRDRKSRPGMIYITASRARKEAYFLFLVELTFFLNFIYHVTYIP